MITANEFLKQLNDKYAGLPFTQRTLHDINTAISEYACQVQSVTGLTDNEREGLKIGLFNNMRIHRADTSRIDDSHFMKKMSNQHFVPDDDMVDPLPKAENKKPYLDESRMNEARIQLLKNLRAAANEVIDDILDMKENRPKGAINYGRLSCVGAEASYADDGGFQYAVIIRKVDPSEHNFHLVVSGMLATKGFPGVDVRTEW